MQGSCTANLEWAAAHLQVKSDLHDCGVVAEDMDDPFGEGGPDEAALGAPDRPVDGDAAVMDDLRLEAHLDLLFTLAQVPHRDVARVCADCKGTQGS